MWYDDKSNVVKLLEFLMDCELVTVVDDVIDLMKYPQKYDEVWKLYQKEIAGVY